MDTRKIDIRERRQELGLSQAKLAELTGIRQHLLSAHELGKDELSRSDLNTVAKVLGDRNLVDQVANRKKRYRRNDPAHPQELSDRSHLYSRTSGNHQYIKSLKELATKHNGSRKQFRALSLFSGCGGFSLGFSAAGFKLCGFVELEKGLRDIYRLNFPSSTEIGGDITQLPSQEIVRHANEIGPVDVIIGGPPCQGFSLSGKRLVDDPRNSLFLHYLRFVDAFKPKVAVLENVRLLMSMKNTKGGFVRDDIANEFKKHGYAIKPFEINAKDYGVPQSRERVIFVAVHESTGITPSIPEKSFGLKLDLFQQGNTERTFGDACSDLTFLESGESCSMDTLHAAVSHPPHVIRWLWDVPQGRSAHENSDERLRPPSGYNTTYKRQVWTEPASTVQTTFGMISGCRNVHPSATRSLTVREAARIQSFPDEYKFEGNLGTIRTGIGNAVPPMLANALAKHVSGLLKSCKSNRLLG